jgi:hypothetical protein
MGRFRMTPMRWFVLLALIDYALSIILAPDPQALRTLNISRGTYREVVIFLLIPETIIWFATFYALTKVSEYTKHLKTAKEGRAFRFITYAIAVLAFGFIIPSIISTILGQITASHEGFRNAATIINQHIAMVVPVIAFTLLNTGAYLLLGFVNTRSRLRDTRIFSIFFITLSVLFAHTALHTRNLGHNPYHLGVYALMFTLIVPYLFAWFEGLASAYNLNLYSKSVKGLLYKKALQQLALGISVTILGFIAIQFITSTLGARTSESLGFILVIIYALLAILLLGLGFIAFGAKKLKKIEEV